MSRGRMWTAIPTRVIADVDRLVVAHWPGTRIRVPASCAAPVEGNASRMDLVEELSAGDWQIVDLTWRGLTMLTIMTPGDWFSVSCMFSGPGHQFVGWYVNFEAPFRRAPAGVETNDLLLDLVVEPDRTWRWKDRDEYERGRQLGFVDDHADAALREAIAQALATIEDATGPLAEEWETWRPDPDWPTPSLP